MFSSYFVSWYIQFHPALVRRSFCLMEEMGKNKRTQKQQQHSLPSLGHLVLLHDFTSQGFWLQSTEIDFSELKQKRNIPGQENWQLRSRWECWRNRLRKWAGPTGEWVIGPQLSSRPRTSSKGHRVAATGAAPARHWLLLLALSIPSLNHIPYWKIRQGFWLAGHVPTPCCWGSG